MNRGRALRQLSACLSGQIPPDADWDVILNLANESLVTSELHRVLIEERGSQPDLPQDVRVFLAEVQRRNRLRNASLFETLRDALAALNSSDIEPVLLKGCALWVTGDRLDSAPATSRLSSDIDLLVTGDAFEAAEDTLAGAGFGVLADCRNDAHHPVLVMGRGSDAGSIDLHKSPPGPRGVRELETLAVTGRTISIAGYRARVPSPELQILTAVLHDQLLDGHFWRGGFELRHLVDIAALSRRPEGVDWSHLQAICRRVHLGAALTAQLMAAKSISGAEVPDAVLHDPLGRLHYWRQRLQFVWPAINRPFHAIGLNRRVWRLLSSRNLSGSAA